MIIRKAKTHIKYKVTESSQIKQNVSVGASTGLSRLKNTQARYERNPALRMFRHLHKNGRMFRIPKGNHIDL